MKALLVAAVVLALLFVGVAETTAALVPLELTGFNRDVVVEVGSSGPPYSTALS